MNKVKFKEFSETGLGYGIGSFDGEEDGECPQGLWKAYIKLFSDGHGYGGGKDNTNCLRSGRIISTDNSK